MDKASRIASIKTQIVALGVYSKFDELALLDEVAVLVATRKTTAGARAGDAALSNTERAEKHRVAKKAAFQASVAGKTAPTT